MTTWLLVMLGATVAVVLSVGLYAWMVASSLAQARAAEEFARQQYDDYRRRQGGA